MNFDEQTYEHIEAYLDQTLSESERTSFEARMKTNTELATEVQISREMRLHYSGIDHNAITSSYDQKTARKLAAHLQSEETLKRSKNIASGKKIYEATAAKKRRTSYLYCAAAAIAILFVIGTFLVKNEATPQELYAANKNWENLPSLTAKGENQNELAKGEAFFYEEKYAEAIAVFNAPQHAKNPQVLLYLGIAQLESNNVDKARMTFDLLLHSNTLDRHKAYWYIALSYLKQGNREDAITYLQRIRKDTDPKGFEKAQKVLAALQ